MIILKILSCLLALLFQGGFVMDFENITDSFNYATKMNITIENMQYTLEKGNDKYEVVLESLRDITKYAHEMPAFGVSIDDLAREDMKTGMWLELVFDEECEYNEMPFEALLIKVDKDAYGFNLIRKQNGKYEGRCFYLSLDNSMINLYHTIENLSL